MIQETKLQRQNILNQEIYIYKEKKYKTIYTSVNFYLPFNKDYIAPLCILSRLIGKTTKTFPTEQSLKNQLQELYDSLMFGLVRKQGDTIIYSFFSSCIHPMFVNSTTLYKDVMILFKEALMKFQVQPELFEKEKRMILLAIENRRNDKYSYAMDRFMKIMFASEEDGYSMYGELESIEKLTIEDVNKMYEMLFHQRHSIFISGDVGEKEINLATSGIEWKECINEKLNFVSKKTKKVLEPKVVVEEIDAEQSIVITGFRTKYRIYKKGLQAMQLFQQMLGGAFSSSLPQIIREQEGLAYSVSSSFDNRNGVLLIVGAISKNNYLLYQEVVKKIILSYQEGTMDEPIFLRAKEQILADILQSVDNPLLGYYQMIARVSGHTIKRKEELIARYKNITKEEIQEVAKGLKIDTTFFLKGVAHE